MKNHRTLLIMAVVAVIAVLAVAGTALAQTPTPAPNQANANYQEFFLNQLAAKLGVARATLDSAIKGARNDTADQAVKDGKLTQQQADRIKAQEGLGAFGPGFRAPRGGGMPGAGKVPFAAPGQVMNAIAAALGMTPADLTAQLRSGKTLKELAQGKEQAVKDAILKVEKDRLDQAVKNGRLTQQQADQAYQRLQQADLLNLYSAHPGRNSGPGGTDKQRPAPRPGNRPSLGPAFSGTGAL